MTNKSLHKTMYHKHYTGVPPNVITHKIKDFYLMRSTHIIVRNDTVRHGIATAVFVAFSNYIKELRCLIEV